MIGIKRLMEWARVSIAGTWSTQLMAKGAVFGFCVFLLVEQFNTAPTHLLDRLSDAQYLGRIPPPGDHCELFYIGPPFPEHRPDYGLQIDAMLIAQTHGVPTVNGYGGHLPKQYAREIFLLRVENYEQAVWRWLTSNGIDQGVCRLDLMAGTWTRVGPPSGLAIGVKLFR
jgi:hypothetical protein